MITYRDPHDERKTFRHCFCSGSLETCKRFTYKNSLEVMKDNIKCTASTTKTENWGSSIGWSIFRQAKLVSYRARAGPVEDKTIALLVEILAIKLILLLQFSVSVAHRNSCLGENFAVLLVIFF